MIQDSFSSSDVADALSVSKSTLKKWEKNGKLVPVYNAAKGRHEYLRGQLGVFPEFAAMQNSSWAEEEKVKPIKTYNSVELFAGAGGLALGLGEAGFSPVILNEIKEDFCKTLKKNRPNWNVKNGDVADIDFRFLNGQVDLVSGGFPCQAFSYAGKGLGFKDIRGTLFYEFARAVKEISPKVLLAENVRGLISHDKGNTLKTIRSIIDELGYELIEPKVLKAIFYKVPQKRERLFLVGIRKDLFGQAEFHWPSPYYRILTLRDALFAGELYDSDVPESEGQRYPDKKREIMKHVPPGGYWRDLPVELQKEYMKNSYYLGGGKTGMARRLSFDEPSLTLTCAPAQKQTERCHPTETRPLTVREYARIQTFPDEWDFCGSISSQYEQIGNAVPVNLAYAVGRSLVRFLNELEKKQPASNYNSKAKHSG